MRSNTQLRVLLSAGARRESAWFGGDPGYHQEASEVEMLDKEKAIKTLDSILDADIYDNWLSEGERQSVCDVLAMLKEQEAVEQSKIGRASCRERV